MANETVSNEDMKPTAGKREDSTGPKKRHKKSSALVAASKARSAVDHVIARSGQDARGSNDLPNTGPPINYENES